VCLLTVCV